MTTGTGACLGEDELLELASGARSLADDVRLEAHLAGCATCGSLVAHVLADAAVALRPPAGGLVGRELGPYVLEALVGSGGMGDVYRARDTRLGRAVAIKVLAGLAPGREPVMRLEREARAAAAVAHPNVLTVHDVGEIDGQPFVVSELCEGETLRSLVDRGAISAERALVLGRQLAHGLAAAHARGVVHRDLNPRNVMVTREGVLKILDFGLAKLAPSGAAAAVDETTPGTVLGTVGYLAPEQARGEPTDARSDLFSVGAILYEMLSGERAFAGETFAERLSAVLRDTPPRLAELGPAGPAIARCLAKDPARRFASAADLAFVLDGLDAAPAAPARTRTGVSRRTFLLGAAGASAAGAVVGWFARPRPAAPTPLAFRPLTFRQGRVVRARLTPDGDRVVYTAEWDGAPAVVQSLHLRGGGARTLDLPAADVLAVSSRGELALLLERRFVDGMCATGRLALAPLEHGEPRALVDGVQDADFTPDGRELLVTRRVGGRSTLELPLGHTILDVDGFITDARLSPDGRHVAFLRHPSVYDDRGEIVVLDRQSGGPRAVGGSWSSASGLAWRGEELWFTAAERGDGMALRALVPGGSPRVVAAAAARLHLHDVDPRGGALLTRDDRRMRLMTGRVGGGADEDRSLTDVSWIAAISADGATLLSGELGDTAGASNGVYLRRPGRAAALRLGDGIPTSLSADGARVLAITMDPAALHVYPTGAGASVRLDSGDLELHAAVWAGEQVVVAGATPGRPPRIWRLGTPLAPLTDEGLAGVPRVSPDGTRVAFVGPDGRLRTVAVGGGAVAVVPGDLAGHEVCTWHADGASVFVRSKTLPVTVRRLDLSTGALTAHAEIVPPALGCRGIDEVVLTPDGSAYAYSFGQELSRLYFVA